MEYTYNTVKNTLDTQYGSSHTKVVHTAERRLDALRAEESEKEAASERMELPTSAARPRSKPHRSKRKHLRPMQRILRRMRKWPAAKRVFFRAGCIALTVTCIIASIILIKSGKSGNAAMEAEAALSPSATPTNAPTPTISPTPSPNPMEGVVIRALGETNAILPAVQERLAELCYMDTPADGYTNEYNSATKIGVLLFQIKNYTDSTQWDGQLGTGTYELLMSDQAKVYYLGRGDGDDRTKIITKLVHDVKKLQDRLIELGYMSITRASGYYGGSTVEAVQTFQQYHGLSPDGRAGQETLHMLYSEEAMDAKTGKQNDRSKLTPTPLPSESPVDHAG